MVPIPNSKFIKCINHLGIGEMKDYRMVWMMK